MALNVQLASEITNNKRLVDDGLCMNSKGSWEEKPGKASQAKRDPKRELGKNPKATRDDFKIIAPGKTVESTTAASLQAPYVKHVNYTHMDDILAESDAEAYRELSKQHQKLLDREISP
eukprot:gene4703-5757_t